jgi:hypothetical protein
MRAIFRAVLPSVLLAALVVSSASAQHGHEGHEHSQSPGQMPGMSMPTGSEGAPSMHQASGTSFNPASAPMEMIHRQAGAWILMFHGSAFITEIQQTGPRGAGKLASMNWFMGVAQRPIGAGTLTFRAMLSLDPATVTQRRYPELFQTGESAYGKPIVDGQHPHDLFMEVSVQYAHRLGEKTTASIYFAPVGDPALGPVAFPHRVSAAELPQAPLSHHWQDSTHIANEVVTAGLTRGIFHLEASGFHGAEPNENRWNIDHGSIDSWSARLVVSPAPNWTGHVSRGRLAHPEALEPGDVTRSTASITYNRPLAAGHWASSLICGRNHKTATQRNTNSYLAESVFQFRRLNYLTGRLELVDKDELFSDDPGLEARLAHPVGSTFRVIPWTLGYTRDVKLIPGLATGFGANFTVYRVPAAIQTYYGAHPVAVVAYMRVRVKGSGGAMHHN